jgi:8-oxo-dGTP pyrophosphatase MutT (NUDIX family)
MHTNLIPLAPLRDRLPRILQQRKRSVIQSPELIPASILVPLFEREGNTHFILIKRSPHVKNHPYQVSFPGGGQKEVDSEIRETALREALEEIGIKKEDVEVLGLFDDYASASNFRITPVIGIIPYPYQFIINPGEVEKLIEVSLSTLMPQNHKKILHLHGKEKETHIFQAGQYTIWGITAQIIRDFLDLLKRELGS